MTTTVPEEVRPESVQTLTAQRLVSDSPALSLATIVLPVVDVVRVAMLSTTTSMDPGVTYTVANFRTHVANAEAHFNGLEATDVLHTEVLRIFIAPEWYFRRGSANGGHYTHAEMRTIVEELKGVSAEFPRWLIVPGTIFFGLGYDVTGGAPNLATLQGDITNCFRLTIGAPDGDPLPVRAEPLNPNAWWVGALGVALAGGGVVHRLFKNYEQDIDQPRRDRDFWAMNFLPPATRLTTAGTTLFTYREPITYTQFNMALEICRDHRMQRTVKEHALAQAASPGLDIHIVVSNHVDVDPIQACPHLRGVLLRCDGRLGTNEVIEVTTRTAFPCRDHALILEMARLSELIDDESILTRGYVAKENRLKAKVSDLDQDIAARVQRNRVLADMISDARANASLLSSYLGWLDDEIRPWREEMEGNDFLLRNWRRARPGLVQQRDTFVQAFSAILNVGQGYRNALGTYAAAMAQADDCALTTQGAWGANGQLNVSNLYLETQRLTHQPVIATAWVNAVLVAAPTPAWRCFSCRADTNNFFPDTCVCGQRYLVNGELFFGRVA
jgi:hypothetical protein